MRPTRTGELPPRRLPVRLVPTESFQAVPLRQRLETDPAGPNQRVTDDTRMNRQNSGARRRSFVVSRPSAYHVRQQAEKAGALDGARDFSLLLGGDRRDPARHDLAALRNVALQEPHVLVVDLRRIAPGERAGLAAAKERAAGL